MSRRLRYYSTCIGRYSASTLVEPGKPHVLVFCVVYPFFFFVSTFTLVLWVGLCDYPAADAVRTPLSYNQSSYKYKF
jgi:hypothetical protein